MVGLIFGEIELIFEIGFIIEFLFTDREYNTIKSFNINNIIFGINHLVSFSGQEFNILNIFKIINNYLFYTILKLLNLNIANKDEN